MCERIWEKSTFRAQDRFYISATVTKHSWWPLCCTLLCFDSCSRSSDMLAWSTQICSVRLYEITAIKKLDQNVEGSYSHTCCNNPYLHRLSPAQLFWPVPIVYILREISPFKSAHTHIYIPNGNDCFLFLLLYRWFELSWNASSGWVVWWYYL